MSDFVTFELAKKLKEKGFNLNCESFYILKDFTAKCVDDCGDLYEVDFTKGDLCLNYPIRYMKYKDSYLSAPTISQVLKWLREKKKIHVEIDIMKAYPEAKLIYWGYNIVLIDKYEVYHFEWNSNSFEQAALAGIEYVLNNLL
jgi:phage pi2 protein 07